MADLPLRPYQWDVYIGHEPPAPVYVDEWGQVRHDALVLRIGRAPHDDARRRGRIGALCHGLAEY
jgi:hypothetical protein